MLVRVIFTESSKKVIILILVYLFVFLCFFIFLLFIFNDVFQLMLKNISPTDEEKQKLHLAELFDKIEGKSGENSDDEIVGSASILKNGEGSSKNFDAVFNELMKISQK